MKRYVQAIPKQFLRGDIKVKTRNTLARHLIFATDKQLNLLKTLKKWFADGTFKCTPFPFVQLLTSTPTMIYHLSYCWKKLPPCTITTIRPAIIFKLLMILKAMYLQIRCTLNFRFFLFFLSFGSNKTIYQQCIFRLNLFLYLSFGCNKAKFIWY